MKKYRDYREKYRSSMKKIEFSPKKESALICSIRDAHLLCNSQQRLNSMNNNTVFVEKQSFHGSSPKRKCGKIEFCIFEA